MVVGQQRLVIDRSYFVYGVVFKVTTQQGLVIHRSYFVCGVVYIVIDLRLSLTKWSLTIKIRKGVGYTMGIYVCR